MAHVTHDLKILPKYFIPVIRCEKTFEIRKNDRNYKYKIGDTLSLNEFDPGQEVYTGRKATAEVTYITDYAQKDDYVVMSIVVKDINL